MHKLSFFSIIKSITIIISNYIIMLGISFLLVSFTFYNHQNDEIEYQTIEIYQVERVETFKSYYRNEDIIIILKFKQIEEETYILSYGYHYYDQYKKAIYLEIDNLNHIYFLTISPTGVATIS